MAKLTQQELETYLWGAANILRGKTAGQDYKTYILTLLFFKRLSDQWDYEADEVVREKEAEFGRALSEKQRQALSANAHVHRFKMPEGAHWSDVLAVSENIGEVLTAATRAIAKANPELTGVFTVDWNQPAPDGSDKLIKNAVVHALIQHFNGKNLSNASVQADVLGRAYEYLIKMFADDAGAKAGEFFTPPEVVDILIRCLEPKPGETIYDPTCGSGGMLVHSADFLAEHGHKPNLIQCFGQEMNWQTYAIARINMILHGLEAEIKGGKSTITEPQFLDAKGGIRQFDMVIANFPFSNEYWWLPEELQTEDEAKKQKKSIAKDGYTDPFDRFTFGTPPLSNGDFAFVQHILASTKDDGRCGVVCPQGVLFRGQPEVEEETGEFDKNGEPKIRRRKADDEYLIRKGILNSKWLDAVIGLPLNIFYGAGVPACLLLMNKNRPEERRDKVLLIYAARHYRELSNKNQLRPQDLMRILVHYHAYGDAAKASVLAKTHCDRLQAEVSRTEAEEVARITLEYEPIAKKLTELQTALAEIGKKITTAAKAELKKLESEQKKLQVAIERPLRELSKRDEEITAARRRAAEDHESLVDTAAELVRLYADPIELVKHVKVAGLDEVQENEHNLNIPRYVDTFVPEERIDVPSTLKSLNNGDSASRSTEQQFLQLAEGLQRLRSLPVESGVDPSDPARASFWATEIGWFPSEWEIVRLDAVATVGSGITLGKDLTGQPTVELPYLRVANVQSGFLDLSEIKTVHVRPDEIEYYKLEPGDILMTEGGDIDKLGRGAIWQGAIDPCLHQNHIFRVRADRKRLDPRFLEAVICCDIGRRYFFRIAKRTTNLASINKTQLKAFRIPLPPIEEQTRIAEALDSADIYVDSMIAKVATLRRLRSGLAQDFLAGDVRIPSSLEIIVR